MKLKYFSLILFVLLLFFISSVSAMSLDDSSYDEFDGSVVDSSDTVVEDSMDVDLDDSDFKYSNSDDSSICVDDLDDDVGYDDKKIVSEDLSYSKKYKLNSDFDSSLFSSSASSLGASNVVGVSSVSSLGASNVVGVSSVSSLGASKTSTTITASNLNMYYGSGKSVVAYLKTSGGKAISGQSVKISIDGRSWTKTTDSNGKVSLLILTLTPAVYPCTIKFAGTSSYESCSKTINVNVTKAPTKISGNTTWNMTYGESKQLIFTLRNSTTNATISGKTVHFTINNKTYNVTTNSSGKAYLSIKLKPGTYSGVLKFKGDSLNNASSKSITINVFKIKTTIISNNLQLYYTANDKISACLKDSKSNVLANKTINIIIDGKSYNKTSNSKGMVYMSVNLKAGTYSCSIKFSGDTYYNTCTKSINVTVFPLVSDKNLLTASKNIKEYFEKNHKLPTTVTIGKNKLSMAEYLLLAGDLIINPSKTSFYFNGSYSDSSNPSENISGGILNSTEYKNVFSRVSKFIIAEGRGPNFAHSSLGDIRFESIVVLASNILYSKSINLENPDFVTVLPWALVSKSSTKFYTEYDVLDAAKRVKSFIERNNRMPSYVGIKNNNITMSSFLKMLSITILNIEGNYYVSIPYRVYGSAPNPKETMKSFHCLNEKDYLFYAVDVNNFMNIFNRAPNYLNTTMGNIGVNNTIYMFCQVLDYYKDNDFMPDKLVINPWSKIINNKTSSASLKDICTAGNNIRNYIYTNHALPSSVKIGSVSVSLDTFLELGSEIILKENYDLASDSIINSISNSSSGSEKIYNVNLGKDEYMAIIGSLSAYILKNKKSPSNLTKVFILDGKNTSFTFSRNSLIYLVADILASYKSYNVLPYEISILSWKNLSSSSSKFFSRDQVINGAKSFIANISSNKISINGVNITKIQFLDILAKTIYNIDNKYYSSVLLKKFNLNSSGSELAVSNSSVLCFGSGELAVSGYLDYSEYMDILNEIMSNLDNNVSFDNSSSSLGDIGLDSLIYMYSQILSNYSSEKALPEDYSFVPWIVISNPGMIYNYNANKAYSELSDAISEANEGDLIAIGISKNYIEDIHLDKMLNIISVPGLDISLISNWGNGSYFILDNSSSGSSISDLDLFNISIVLNNSSSNTISNLNIINSSDGIILLNSSDNEISYNYISNCKNGIFDLNSSDNEFDSNVLCNNDFAIKLDDCENEYLEGNLISNNTVGILINNSSSILEYNAIFSNKNQGIIINNSKDVDLDNNWWGNNTPVLSDKYLENVSIYSNSNILFDSWLILNLDIVDFYTNTTNQKYSKIIKASLVNNLGKDVYVDNLPLLPIIFSVNGELITSILDNGLILEYSDYLEEGIAIAELSGNYSGLINVYVILANEVINVSTELLSVNEYPVINLKNNKKFKTIGEAINDLNTSDGDTIKIKGGYYEDNLFIYKKINLISDGEVVIVPLNTSKSTISILSDNVVLNNLTIYGGFDSQAISIFGSNVAILNCNILKSAVGLYLFESSNSSLINNTISSSDYGIYLDNSNNNSFLFNWIKDNSYGIITSNSNSNIFNSNNIFDNLIGVKESSINNSYNSNNIFDNKEGIFINDGINSSFKDNLVFDNYIGLFKYLTNDSSLFLASVIENNTLANVQSFDTGDLVLQDDIWNCGPATLVNLFKIYGLNITQEEIAYIAGTNSNGTSLYGLYLTCIHYGFNVSAWYLDSDSLKVNDLVVLLLDDEYHFTLIKNINETTVSLVDSTFGIIDMDKDDFEDIFLGYVLELNPSSDRGLRLNINQMKNVTGNFFPLVAAGIYMGAAVIGASIGYLAYKFSSQIRSAAKWTYNHAKSIGAALVYGGAYAVSKAWQGYKYKSSKRVSYTIKSSKRFKTSSTKYKTKAPSTGYKINKELNKFLNIGSTKVNYSPSTGKYYIKGYGYSTSSKLVSKGVSSKLLAEVQYKVLYSIYTKSKTKERNKLSIKKDDLQSIRFDKMNRKNIAMNEAPKPPEGNQTKFLEELYKFSLKHYNKGKSLINEGHTLKGLGHIAVSAWGVDFSAVYLIYSLLPKDVFNNRG